MHGMEALVHTGEGVVTDAPDWICEAHPALEWPHDDCSGPGMPPIDDPVDLAWVINRAFIVEGTRTAGAYGIEWWAKVAVNEKRITAAILTAAKDHCQRCGCLWDDHTPPEEVDDGIPFARAASGETDPTQIVTCGDCAECYEAPPVRGQEVTA